ncbi:MAG TPA: hypothetical protein VFW30_07365 [Bryocella sp.]|nr:hypothetical protein [Bryocella sp.]
MHLEEGGDLSVHDPHFDVGGLLADDWSNDSGDTAYFYVDVVAPGSMADAADSNNGSRTEDVDSPHTS